MLPPVRIKNAIPQLTFDENRAHSLLHEINLQNLLIPIATSELEMHQSTFEIRVLPQTSMGRLKRFSKDLTARYREAGKEDSD